MIRFFAKLFARKTSSRHLTNHLRVRPQVEALENRLVPSTLTTTSISLTSTTAITQPVVKVMNGDIYIYGTDAADNFEVSYRDGIYTVMKSYPSSNSYPPPPQTWKFTASQVYGGDVYFYGYGGDDTFRFNESYCPYDKMLRVTAYGGAGNDTLWGASKNDYLVGGDGNDTLRGGPGDDQIYGQNGDDVIYGGLGNDTIDGGNGMDYLYGDNGNDTIWCGTDYSFNYVEGSYGDDTIYGGYGRDEIYGGDGNDWIDGSYGNDYLDGGAGNDILYAGNDSEANYLVGGVGNDYLYGSYGDDLLDGGAGNDYLDGGAGNDIIYYQFHDTSIYGGSGADTFYPQSSDDDVDWYEFWKLIGGDYNPTPSPIRDFNYDDGDRIVD